MIGFFMLGGTWLFFASPFLLAASLVKPSSLGFKNRKDGFSYYSSLIGVGVILASVGAFNMKKPAQDIDIFGGFLGVGMASFALVEPKTKLFSSKIKFSLPKKEIKPNADNALVHQILEVLNNKPYASVVDIVLITKREIKEIEATLEMLTTEGYICMDIDSDTGKIIYRL